MVNMKVITIQMLLSFINYQNYNQDQENISIESSKENNSLKSEKIEEDKNIFKKLFNDSEKILRALTKWLNDYIK